MSNSIDPADIKAMTFTSQLEGPPIVNQPWKRFQLIEEAMLDQGSPYFKPSADRQRLKITCANGWARYRRIKFSSLDRYIWELCDSAYEAKR